ncbi:MAG: YpmA family protein [Clostridia bacterium]|nr:YpmA family protein [Clostridia bacterium]
MKEDQLDSKDKLELIATKTFGDNSEFYKVVDFLNKSLKEKRVMFGLKKDSKNGTMTITIYDF